MRMADIHAARRARLQEQAAALGADAALITSLVNVRYLTGLASSNAALLLPSAGTADTEAAGTGTAGAGTAGAGTAGAGTAGTGTAVLATDSRYAPRRSVPARTSSWSSTGSPSPRSPRSPPPAG